MERLDEIERAIVAALHIHPRASWELIGRALGISESTVARRAQRLFASGQVAVVGVVERTRRDGAISASVRLTCKPGTAERVGLEAAHDPNVRFAGLITGSAVCALEAVAQNREELLQVLEQRLSNIDGVVGYSAQPILGTVAGLYTWTPEILEPSVVARLSEGTVLHPGEAEADDGGDLNEQECAILEVLRRDGRSSVVNLAAAAQASQSTVRRRLESLIRRGILHFRAIIEPSVLGFDVELMLWLEVNAAEMRSVGRHLASNKSFRYLKSVVGDYNLLGAAVLRSEDDILTFVTDVVGNMPGLRRVETRLVLCAFKRQWHLLPR